MPEDQAIGKQSSFNEIEEMIYISEENDFRLNKWQFMIQESREVDIQGLLDSLEERGVHLKKEVGADSIKYVGNRQKMADWNETFIIVRAKESSIYQLKYIITGSEFDQSLHQDYKGYVESITKDLFTENAQNFSCIESVNSGMIDIVSFIKSVEQYLDLKYIDKIEEENFYTWSGYTPKWENVIPLGESDMNVQIALREKPEDKTILTIGTPILVTEY